MARGKAKGRSKTHDPRQGDLYTHPGTSAMDAALVECIEACSDCAQLCSACADACLGEQEVEHMRRCITIRLN